MTGSLVCPSKQCVAMTIIFMDATAILTIEKKTYTFKRSDNLELAANQSTGVYSSYSQAPAVDETRCRR
jgi:hypothetical protein